jgi:hypothetical protein
LTLFSPVARAGFGGLALLCLLRWWFSSAWHSPGIFCCHRRSAVPSGFYIARLVRDSIAEISPFSPVGGGRGGTADGFKRHERRLCGGVRRGRRHHRSHGAGGVSGVRPGLGLTQFRHLEGAAL